MYICTCNNCGNIFEDRNEHPKESTVFPDDTFIQELELLNDGDGSESYYGCPVCQTDGYLTDNINEPALNANAKSLVLSNNLLNFTTAS